MSRIYALLSSNPPECQDWGKGGGGQANFGNAKIFPGPVTPTPPLGKQRVYDAINAEPTAAAAWCIWFLVATSVNQLNLPNASGKLEEIKFAQNMNDVK